LHEELPRATFQHCLRNAVNDTHETLTLNFNCHPFKLA
jgi:hypothetical protein